MSTASYRLRALPTPLRVLLISFLVMVTAGFTMAHVNLHLQHAHVDGEPGLSIDDVVGAYHGLPGMTVLTSKVDGGSMQRYIPRPRDKQVLLDWVASGADESAFSDAGEVLDRLCVRCHHPGGEMSQVAFATSRADGAAYALVAPSVQPAGGKSAAALARSSHAHLFGMSVLFALVGFVFLGTDAGVWTKCVSVSLPYVAMAIDIGCWWLTRWTPEFAFGVVAGGALLAAATAWLVGRSGFELLTPHRASGAIA